jgi:hypothetical protein
MIDKEQMDPISSTHSYLLIELRQIPDFALDSIGTKQRRWNNGERDKGGLAWREGCWFGGGVLKVLGLPGGFSLSMGCCSPLDLANTAPYSFRYRDIFFHCSQGFFG